MDKFIEIATGKYVKVSEIVGFDVIYNHIVLKSGTEVHDCYEEVINALREHFTIKADQLNA